MGAVLATIDDLFEETRPIILINTGNEVVNDEDKERNGYFILFGYNLYKPKKEMDEDGWFNFQAHLMMDCIIKDGVPRIFGMTSGILSGGYLKDVYLLERPRVMGDIPCLGGASRVVPIEAGYFGDYQKLIDPFNEMKDRTQKKD